MKRHIEHNDKTMNTSSASSMNTKTPNNPTSITNSTNNNTKPRLKSILGSFLETAIHELLYLRSLYPHDAFTPSRHLQIAVHACRHPAVVEYIYDTLKIAVPSIIKGEIDALYLIFWDENTNEVYERFSFEFDDSILKTKEGVEEKECGDDHGTNEHHQNLGYVIQELERSLRDVLLSIMSLEGSDLGRKRGMKTFTDSTTFKLCLHTKKNGGSNNMRKERMRRQQEQVHQQQHQSSHHYEEEQSFCPELKEAIESGKWMRSESRSYQLQSFAENNSNIHNQSPNENLDEGVCISRPLKSLNAPLCGLRMQLVMDCKN